MKTILIVGGIILLFLAGLIGYNFNQLEQPLGSVQQGGEYKYLQLSGAVATSTAIKTTRGTLGSVIITEDQAGAVVLYDATSTAAVTDGTYSTAIADFQAAEPEGTYTFDTSFNNGLVFVSADGFSFAGDWTITYR